MQFPQKTYKVIELGLRLELCPRLHTSYFSSNIISPHVHTNYPHTPLFEVKTDNTQQENYLHIIRDL